MEDSEEQITSSDIAIYLVKWVIFTFGVSIMLSVFFKIPYACTIVLISTLPFIGHVITLDDDYPGGFSNQDESVEIWKSSLFQLLIKLLVIVALGALIFIFPKIA